MGLNCLDGVTLDQQTVCAALTVRFEDVDGFDVVLGPEVGFLFDGFDGVNHEVGEEVGVGVDEFAGHGGLGAVQQCFLSEGVHVDCQFVLDIATALLGCDFEAGDDVGGVHLDLNEFVGPFQQFCGQDNDGGGPVSDLCILKLRELDEEIGDGVFDFEFFEDGGAWVRGEIPSLVMVTSPRSSTIILSRPWGPRDERTMLATDMAARTK